jgi:uracil-DNA glycosylase
MPKEYKYLVERPVNMLWHEGARVMVIGAAPRADEVVSGEPFADQINYFLRSVLRGAGLAYEDCAYTYLFQHKAPQDDLKYFFVGKQAASKAKKDGWHPKYPPQTRGFLAEAKESEMERLAKEINIVNPNVIIALGPDVLWALTGYNKIGTYRGTVMETWNELDLDRSYKVIPTYAIESVLFGMYDNKPIMSADFSKAKTEAEYPEIRTVTREAWIEPTLDDMERFYIEYILPMQGGSTPLAYDIETMQKWDEETNEHYITLTCIGFAPSPYLSITIPFFESGTGNYWATDKSELRAWDWIRKILEDSEIKKLTHNAIYDISWMAYHAGIKTMGIIEDTMHMHHAMQPELPKGLGILGSIYTNETAWKTMAKKGNKRDE